MKKYLLIIFLCSTITVLGQNNTSPFPVSGNVGIGTTTPIHSLHIIRPTNAVTAIGLEQSNINMWRFGMAANSPDLRFSPSSDALTNSVFTIQQSGNVGVGTLNPLTKFYVDGDIGIPSFKKIKVGYFLNIQEHIKLENEYDRALIAQGLIWDNDNNRYDLTANALYNRNGMILGNGGIKFFAHQGNVSSNPSWSHAELNSKVRLFISNTGQLGVGTVSPQYGSLEIFQNSAEDGGDKSYLSLHRGGQIDWQLGLKDNSFVIANGGGATRTNLWETKNFTINPNGNVGIGIINPTNKLDVNGDINISDNNYYKIGGVLAMYKSSNYQVLSDKEGRNAIYLGGEGDKGNYYDNTSHLFRSRDGQINYMTLTNNNLSLNGNLSSNGTITSRYSTILHTGNLNFLKNADTTGHLLFSDSPNNRMVAMRRLLSGEGNNGLGFYGFTNNIWTTILTMKDGGNVGIGTINPISKLAVRGGVTINNDNNLYGLLELYQNSVDDGGDKSYLSMHRGGQIDWQLGLKDNSFVIANGGGATRANLWENKNFIINPNGNVGIGTTTPLRKFHVVGGDGLAVSDAAQNGIGIISNDGVTTAFQSFSASASNITFATNSTGLGVTEKMKINGNGQVIIGTTNSILPADYKLAVAGNIIAEKVKVKKSNTWPDYVFAPSYKLPTLTEVESFIKQNKHLPEIPSANEIEKDGQDLGEMNRLLLKKVEELTLYLIEVEKKNKEQDILIQKLLNK